MNAYTVPPAPGAERVTLAELQTRMKRQHDLFRAEMGESPGLTTWGQDPYFTLLRATCICHTLIVTDWYADPADPGTPPGYAVIDITDEGPTGALGADIRLGFGSYAEAAAFVAAHLASEAENCEPGDTALAARLHARMAEVAAAVKAQERIEAALKLIRDYGATAGDHHKTWVIDQVRAALTGTEPRGQGIAP
jgi:hypothetical protein